MRRGRILGAAAAGATGELRGPGLSRPAGAALDADMLHPRFASCLCCLSLVTMSACVAPVRVVSPASDAEVPHERLIDDLATADVVVLGERHGLADLHELHRRILRDLTARRRDVIVSLEMFDRDVQPVLWQYLLGDIDEAEFLAKARPWSNYGDDYRPLVEFARANDLEVLAANAPREFVDKVAKHGIAAVPASPHLARTTTAPDDAYLAAFRTAMQGHPGIDGEPALLRAYAAQCLRDDTMAESILDRLQKARVDNRRPLVVHFCGHLHSDHRRGTVARLLQREPELRIKVLGVESVPTDRAGTLTAAPSLADYVVLVPDAETNEVEPTVPTPVAAEPTVPAVPVAPAAPSAPAGGRPGLGFRPEYETDVQGCVVGDVVPGGAAANAGIEAGDVIVEFDGQAVDSVSAYATALGTVEIGDKVEVVVRRGERTLKLPVVVGRSSR